MNKNSGRHTQGQKSEDPSTVDRRSFFKKALKLAGALPFTILIPSQAATVFATEEQLRPQRAREKAFQESLELAQITRPGGVPLPPGTRFPRRPPKTTSTTLYTTQTKSEYETATMCGNPRHNDDAKADSYGDDENTDRMQDAND